MNFHRRTLNLVEPGNIVLDPEREAVVVRVATAAGIILPPAVAEWYSLHEQSSIWKAYARHDESFLFRLSSKDQPTTFGRAVHDKIRQEWWEVPPMMHDLRGWISEPILPLMAECCGTWWWGVVLDAAPDPRAVVTHDEGETWELCGASFSEYVRGLLFDAVFDSKTEAVCEVQFEGPCALDGKLRQRLLADFHREPTTRDVLPGPIGLTERFSQDRQRFRFHYVEQFRWQGSCWRLWGATQNDLFALMQTLSSILPAFRSVTPQRGSVYIPLPKCHDDPDIPF